MKEILIPKLKKPTLKELQKKYSWLRSIERDDSPTKNTPFVITSVLKDGEDYISGNEYESRIPKDALGYQQAVWLVEHQDEFPEFMDLLGKVYIDFSGLVVVYSDGYRHFPCLYQDDGRWYLHWRWIDSGFDSDERVASSGKQQSETGKLDSLELGNFVTRREFDEFKARVEKVINLNN